MLQAFEGLSEVFGGADTVQEKRVTVLQLHVAELEKLTKQQAAELRAAQAKLKEASSVRAVTQPQERKLFQRIEKLGKELQGARDQTVAAERRTAEAQAQLEKVVAAADAQASGPTERLLLRVTTEQLDATQQLLLQAQRQSREAEEQRDAARRAAASAEAEAAAGTKRELELQKRLAVFVQKVSAANELSLAPPSKGNDLEQQYHILQLNWRHLQAELQRKTVRGSSRPPGRLERR